MQTSSRGVPLDLIKLLKQMIGISHALARSTSDTRRAIDTHQGRELGTPASSEPQASRVRPDSVYLRMRDSALTVRSHDLHDPQSDASTVTSAADRLAMMWQLTLDAWALTGLDDAESRLPRHIVRVQRQGR